MIVRPDTNVAVRPPAPLTPEDVEAADLYLATHPDPTDFVHAAWSRVAHHEPLL